MEKLDKVEVGYNKETVTLMAYDGRKLEGFVYMPKNTSTTEYLPSPRYLGVLCKGARQANLDPGYIERLANRPVYNSEGREEVQLAREERERARHGLKEVRSVCVHRSFKHQDQVPFLFVSAQSQARVAIHLS